MGGDAAQAGARAVVEEAPDGVPRREGVVGPASGHRGACVAEGKGGSPWGKNARTDEIKQRKKKGK